MAFRVSSYCEIRHADDNGPKSVPRWHLNPQRGMEMVRGACMKKSVNGLTLFSFRRSLKSNPIVQFEPGAFEHMPGVKYVRTGACMPYCRNCCFNPDALQSFP